MYYYMYIVRSETSPVRWKFGFTKAMPPHQWIPGQKPNETQILELLTLLKKASSAELGMGGILTDLESGNSTLLLAESGRQAWLGGCFRKGHWNWSEDPIFPCDIGLTLKWIAVFSIPQKLSMDVRSTWWFAPAFRDGSDSAATETSAVRIPTGMGSAAFMVVLAPLNAMSISQTVALVTSIIFYNEFDRICMTCHSKHTHTQHVPGWFKMRIHL